MTKSVDIVAGIKIPDSAMAKAATELVQDTETDLLFHHSRRVFLFGALAGERKNLSYDPELLYIGAMFHDMGIMDRYASDTERFEVDGANAARDFLSSYDVAEREVDDVWDSIALHTTPGIPQHKRPIVALVTAGVEMDVLGIGYDEFPEAQRKEVCECHPRGLKFKHGILTSFCLGTIRKPETTFGNVKADVLSKMDPSYERRDFAEMILNSPWDS
ncbi:HD domain-containing protein [Rhizobium sp. ZW T2_16]|uniref:HD domain-containing protein n=1 Tax=Rhizobium sp. ZW T2_16 TaxID=3378083 RepID=UPI0038550968